MSGIAVYLRNIDDDIAQELCEVANFEIIVV